MTTILFDGNNIARKNFHAMQNLTDSHGAGTGAIYGTLNSIYRLLKRVHPEKFAVMWDYGKSKWRTDMYPEYKAKRAQRTPEQERELHNFIKQMEVLRKALDMLGVIQIGIYGVEADDLMGIAVRLLLYENDDSQIKIASADKDFYQLLNSRVQIIKDWRTTLDVMTQTRFVKKYGFDPSFWPDMLAMMGDKDEVPGIKFVGEKHASAVVRQYGNISNILKNTEPVPKALVNTMKKILAQADDVRLYRRLAKIVNRSDVFDSQTERKINRAMHGLIRPKKVSIDTQGFQNLMFDLDMMTIHKNRKAWFKIFRGEYV